MNIVHTIRNETVDYRDKTAIIEGDRQIFYQDLFTAVGDIANELKTHGVRPGKRVALLCGDSIDYIIVSLAVLSVHAAIVPISPSLSGDELDAVLKRIDVNFLVFDKAVYFRDDALPVFSGTVCEKEFFLYRRAAREQLPASYYELNPAFIRFSSGTTAASKGVVLSHESVIERTDAADKVLNMTADDVVIWVLSMSFHFVVTILLFLRRAATIALCGGTFPESLQEGLIRHRGTFLYASPFHYHVLSRSDIFSRDLLSGVRLAVTTAINLPVSGARDFYEKFGFELTEAYGIIEVGLPFVNSSQDVAKRGSVGRILPDYEVKIVNADAEGIGEVYLRGKGMFDAYFSPWQDRQRALPGGWFNTGDLGRLDKDGFLFLVGREKNIINFAGMKIFPYEVESILNQHPAIKESMVYGVPHPQYGELPCARIVLRDEIKAHLDIYEMRRFCYRHLATYKVPKEYHCVARLDKTASGKLRRW
ncbi:MAG: acyl--CoA ligase [Desulfobacterales bacterium]|nr:acyl--CoA ligase [Desulfobacterales bacterium]